MRQLLSIIPFSLLTFPAIAQDATSYQCTMSDLTRRVEIFYETGVSVPCEVHYYKDTEAPGERQVLWSAMNEEGYCEARTTEFVAKLQDMGWTCTARGTGDDDAAADDTEALAPAEAEIEIPESEPPQS